MRAFSGTSSGFGTQMGSLVVKERLNCNKNPFYVKNRVIIYVTGKFQLRPRASAYESQIKTVFFAHLGHDISRMLSGNVPVY